MLNPSNPGGSDNGPGPWELIAMAIGTAVAVLTWLSARL